MHGSKQHPTSIADEAAAWGNVQISWTADLAEARRLIASGHEPVECAFGASTVTGALGLDHHGPDAPADGVALRAYQAMFGARQHDPRFVVTGRADADACFAIAALCGLLPHPSQTGTRADGLGARDLSGLADLINRVDTAPIGIHLAEEEWGPHLLLWNRMASCVGDALAFLGGVDRWRAIVERPHPALLQTATTEERERVARARQAEITLISDQVAVVLSDVWGFDVWYDEVAPVILTFDHATGRASVGCRDERAARRLFGAHGLVSVFPKLAPPGWGGREAIGGSPRGTPLSWPEVLAAAILVATSVLPSAR
jgi:hypothetical protein